MSEHALLNTVSIFVAQASKGK